MRIDPGFQGGPLHGRRIGRPAQGASSASQARSDHSAETDSVGSSESTSLAGALHEIPDVRSELIEEIRGRLERGEFLTRDAAEKTADAILADLASFIGQ